MGSVKGCYGERGGCLGLLWGERGVFRVVMGRERGGV